MRFYDIQLGQGKTSLHYTSHPSGPTGPKDPGALQVEFDIPQVPFHNTNTQGWLRIWGISLQDIAQSRNFNAAVLGMPGAPVVTKGGMGKGLPLANPNQAGTLVQATIFQAFGNWIGTNMTLDLQFMPGQGLVPPQFGLGPPPRNFSISWKANTALSDAIKQTLNAAFPGVKTSINISQNLTLPNDETGFNGNFSQFAEYVNDISRHINNDRNYLGVSITWPSDTIVVSDGTQPPPVKNIAFTDLIGQPTWILPNMIQVNTVMRGDLSIGDQITLPPSQVTTTSQSFSQFRQGSAFQGTFIIQRIRHIGNFRSPDGTSWITTIEAVNIPQPAQPTPSGTVSIENLNITGPSGEIVH
jgi:hypothetical protein